MSRSIPNASPELRTRVFGEAVPRSRLAERDRARMFELLAAYFHGVDRESFDADLDEKDAVVVMRDEASRTIQGFSTLMRLEAPIGARPVTAFYSGDTIVERRFWGTPGLHTAWFRHVYSQACAIQGSEVYWFFVSSGYKTYRFLPVFFNEFFPTYSRPTPAAIKERIDCFARMRFGNAYDPTTGIVTFPKPVSLRAGVAEVSQRELDDPHVAYFVRANPEHFLGQSLACIAPLSLDNLTRAGRRVVGHL